MEIKVSARLLRHISRGIYRTPAAALKELVSNAYDARATEVSINTGFPTFESIVVTDNGDGMSQGEFKTLVQRIGLSNKIAGDILTTPGSSRQRRVIGHYGIGLLAVGQLAARMRITSKQRDSTHGFMAELDFNQFEERLEEGIKRSLVKDESELERRDTRTRDEQRFSIGKCTLWPVTFKTGARRNHFTKIELSLVRAEVKNKLAGRLNERNPKAVLMRQHYFATLDGLLTLLRDNEGEVRQGQYPYERLCWELAVYCPLAYPNVGLFKKDRPLGTFAQIAEEYNFSVVIDGLRLRKPFEREFFNQDNPITKYWSWLDETYAKDASGRKLKVSGYLLLKQQIRPKPMQGILIREAGVAIGLYDTTYMEYPFNEGYKFNQLTGEIFAEGLSGALNIDRNSFNETDDRYLALASWLHDKLQKRVFPAIKVLQKQPSASRREANRIAVCAALVSVARAVGRRSYKVKHKPLGKEAPLLAIKGRALVINQDHRDGTGSSSKMEKVLLAASLVMAGYITLKQLDQIITAIEDAKKSSNQ